MALENVDTPYSPGWWMVQLAKRLLDRNRLMRLATLDAYRSGYPPLLNATEAERRAYYAFMRVSRSNFARVIVRAPAERMHVRSIRTAAANDDSGDEVAWRYWRGAGLDVAEVDVFSDMLTFSDAYLGAAVRNGMPVATKLPPWSTISVTDPMDPTTTVAALHLAWDEFDGTDYAYLWLPGQQWVASRERKTPPPLVHVPGTTVQGRLWARPGLPRLSFSPTAFTMRPDRDEVGEDAPGPYCETYDAQIVPVVRFGNRDGVGEFEEHLDLLDRINHTVATRVVTAAVQAYKQRALEQDGTDGRDKLPATDPETGESIDWDEVFMPGPDALWKLPPGVKIWESGETQLQPILSAATDDMKMLSAVSATPFALFSPDGVNQSAAGALGNKEPMVFKVEDRDTIAGRHLAQFLAIMFMFAPDADRYDADRNDRADPGKIVIDWAPAERYSLQEKAGADSLNKSLSPDMAAAKIWNLTPDEVGINRAQRAAEALLAPAPAPAVTGGSAA